MAQQTNDVNKLNSKQERFCHEFIIDDNATLAARRAGYSEKTARQQGSRLLTNAVIKSHIEELRKEQVERLKMSADEVLIELANIAKGDIKDFLSFKTERVVIGYDDDGNPLTEVRQVIDMKPSDEVDGRLVQEVSVGKDGSFKFKLYDKKGALDSLGRVHKLFVDRSESESNNNHNHKVAVVVDFGIPRPPKESEADTELEQIEDAGQTIEPNQEGVSDDTISE